MKTNKINHKNQERIKVDFPYNQEITKVFRQINDARWSRTHGAWHIPDTAEATRQLKQLFPEIIFEDFSLGDQGEISQHSDEEILVKIPFNEKQKVSQFSGVEFFTQKIFPKPSAFEDKTKIGSLTVFVESARYS